jgi:hypothetical protein
MVSLTFRLPNSDREIDVALQLEAIRTLISELRESDAALADAVDLAGRGEASSVVILRQGDDDRLAVAVRLLIESHRIDDPELSKLAEL